MLNKLFKHEFRASGRLMLPVIAAMLSATLLVSLFNSLTRHFSAKLINGLFGASMSIFVLCIIALCVMCVVVTVYRFYRNYLCDEGYLMFSIPATTHTLVFSKLLSATVWFLISCAVIVLCILGFSFAANGQPRLIDLVRALPELIADLRRALSGTEVSLLHLPIYALEALILFITLIWGAWLRFYAAMSIGHSFHTNRNLLSVVFYFALAWVFRIALIVLFVFLGRLDASGISWGVTIFSAESFAEAARSVHGVLWVLIGLTLIYDTLLYLITALGLRKHLNIA